MQSIKIPIDFLDEIWQTDSKIYLGMQKDKDSPGTLRKEQGGYLLW